MLGDKNVKLSPDISAALAIANVDVNYKKMIYISLSKNKKKKERRKDDDDVKMFIVVCSIGTFVCAYKFK